MRVMPPKEARVRCRTGSEGGLPVSQPCDFPRMVFFVSDRINRMDKMNTADLDGQNSVDSVHCVEKPLPNGASGMSDMEGKAATGSGERDGSRSSINSTKLNVSGTLHKDVSMPFRE